MKITRQLFFVLLLPVSSAVLGQNATLQNYVRTGLDNNLALRQKQFDLEKSQLALAEAKRLFYPNVDLGATYTLAGGGRTIEIPVGDLMNPVYQTLNQLTQSNLFPTIENQKTQFLPNNFLDARLRSTAPIINPDIKVNRLAKEDMVGLQQAGVELYQRELSAQIKNAYIDWLAAEEAVKIYENAIALLKENLRVNESLLRNDKINRSPVLEAESSLRETEADLAGAKNTVAVAGAYFNFLLNRPLESPIEAVVFTAPDSIIGDVLQPSTNVSPEEMRQLDAALSLSGRQLDLEKNWNKPRVSSFLDLGAQGFVDDLDKNAPYFMLGAQLAWNLFDFGKNDLRRQQADVDIRRLTLQKEEIRQQIALREFSARRSLISAWETYRASAESLASAREYYRIAEKTWRNDQANYLELTDARTRLTSAELRLNLDQFEVLKKIVAYERATYSSIL
jgi:outer membrane protein TolC